MIARRTARAPTLALLTVLAAAACATVGPLPNASQLLAAGEAEVDRGNYDAALDVLDALDGEYCPLRLRDRRDVAIATAELGRGRPWDAFLVLQPFSEPDHYPHSEQRGRVVDLLWQIGHTLTESDGGFLFFWSDARAGQTVLEHLITRHPDTQRLADALRILGDIAFEDGNYELAQARYRDIILNRPESDWRFYAQFRFAMSIVQSLRGPDYDLDRMEHAVRELRSFLATQPEQPQLREQTEQALEQVVAWQVQRHLDVADYYRTLDCPDGVRHHLELATRPEFRDAPRYDEAVERRDALDRAEPATPAGGRP